MDHECGFSTPIALIVSGPTIQVYLEPFAGIGSATTQTVPALIDSGATACAIDEALAQQLQFPIVDQAKVSDPSGVRIINVFLAQLYLPPFGRRFPMKFGGIQLQAGGQFHRVLIGRTVLQYFRLTYDGRSGSVKLTTP
jgi:hypothetical protein